MQNTWKLFMTVPSAIGSTRGSTREAIDLVGKNLYLDERVQLVATCSVNDYGNWNDGCVIVSNRRLFVSYAHEGTGQVLALSVDIPPAPRFSELQSTTNVRRFQITGINVQTVGLTSEQYEGVTKAIDRIAGVSSDNEPAAPPNANQPAPKATEDPVESLATMKRLLDEGLVSQAEYDAKKQEILSRL